MTFLLDKLKGIGTEEKEEGKGFDDLNYVVGNTSGMDVTQQIPSDLAERVGQMAQRGGSAMEIQIGNPSTFFIDREDLYNTVEGLGIDISIHSDPNVGYTSSYREGQGRGFDPTHDYFKQYLEAFASFKEEKQAREQNGEFSFKIDRINPHISTDGLPALEERMAQDVGLDPFGYNISEFNEKMVHKRNTEGENIWANPEFLRRFYKLFVVDEIGDNEYRYFGNFYTSFSSEFDKEWRKKRNQVLNQIYDDRTGAKGGRLMDKIELLSAASMRETVEPKWIDIMRETKLENPVKVDKEIREGGMRKGPEEINTLKDLDDLISALSQRYRFSQLRTLPEIYSYIKDADINSLKGHGDRLDEDTEEKFTKKLISELEGNEKLSGALDDLWKASPRDQNKDIKISLISVDSKLQAVVRVLEIPKNRVPERAFENNKDNLRKIIENMFAGEDLKKYFCDDEENEKEDDWKRKHRRFLQSFARNFEQQMWMESNLFYKIIPAWMASSDCDKEDGHDEYMGPKFIWKYVVERKWKDKENVELDLKDPRTPNGSDTKKYFDLLENNNEFQMDVAAAVGAVYMWSHFTQQKDNMGFDGNKHISSHSGEYTWIEWMNRFGIGVNMETMAGSPNQLFKLWRPKDCVAGCRAINITARRQLREEGELGGKDHMAENLDECPVKFTIDMEHVSSFGVDPLEEMRELKEREKDILENPIKIDGEEVYTPGDAEKPLAKMVRMYHLTKPGHETKSGVGHTHGPFRKGNTTLYRWLYKMVEWGFTRTGDNEKASVMYEVGGDQAGTVYQAKLAMDMIQLGINPDEDLDPSRVEPGKDYDSREEALLARFFDMDKSHFSSEWAKIEANAFAPLKGLMEAKTFDKTYSSAAAIEEGEMRPQEYPQEEYK